MHRAEQGGNGDMVMRQRQTDGGEKEYCESKEA